MGAAGQPMPNQQMPTESVQPMQPTQPMQQMPEQMVSVEEQMMTAMNEPMPMSEPLAAAPVMEEPKKSKSNGMLIGMVLAIVVAVAGIAFGVIMMLTGNSQKADYDKQISSLKAANNSLQKQLDEVEVLNGDEALSLLQAAAVAQSLPYGISYANVYAKYDGEDDITAYWVKYMPVNVPEGVAVANNIIFTLNEDGEWEFVLPGFDVFTQELADNYVLLDGSEIVVPVAPAPAPEAQPEPEQSVEE